MHQIIVRPKNGDGKDIKITFTQKQSDELDFMYSLGQGKEAQEYIIGIVNQSNIEGLPKLHKRKG